VSSGVDAGFAARAATAEVQFRGLILDGLLCALATIALAGVMYFGVFSFSPRAVAAEAKTIARLEQLSGEVRRRSARQLVWRALQAEDGVAAGDAIFVEPDSEAVFLLEDGTRLEVDESSLLVFADPAATTAAGGAGVHLRRGGLVSQVGGTGLRIATERGALAAGRDARVRVRAGVDAVRLDVLAGQARLEGPEARSVSAGQRLLVEAQGVTETALAVRLDAPADGARADIVGNVAERRFRWLAASGGRDHFELAADSGFKDVIHRELAGAPRVAVAVDRPGVYYWRVARETSAGAQHSEERRLVVVEHRPPIPLRPWDGEVVYAPDGSSVNFFWQGISTSRRYRVLIATSADATSAIVDQQVKADAYLHRDPLGEGHYYWRVEARDPAAHGVPPSVWVSFRLVRRPLPEIPQVLEPEIEVGPQQEAAPPTHEGQGAWLRRLFIGVAHAAAPARQATHVLRWKPVSGAASYQLEISDAEAFTTVLHSAEVKTTYHRWRPPTGARSYWFRVRSLDAQRRESPYSAAKLLPAFSLAPELVEPATDALFTWKQRPPSIALRWQGSKVAASYRLQVAGNAAFATPLLNKQVGGEPQLSWQPEAPGVYHWRVQTVDVNGTASPFSSPDRFEVRAGAPALSSPAAGAKLPQTPAGAALRLRWSPRPVVRYQLQVARGPGFKQAISRETERTEETVRVQKPGAYHLRVRGLAVDGRPTPWSPSRRVLVQVLELVLLSPPSEELVTQDGERGAVDFRWQPVAGAAQYQLTLSAITAVELPEIPRFADTAARIDELPAGDYAWSVQALDAQGASLATSEPRRFTLALTAPSSAPALVAASMPTSAPAPTQTAVVEVSPLATGWRLTPRFGVVYNLGDVVSPQVEVELLYRLPFWERRFALAISPGYLLAGRWIEDQATALSVSSYLHRWPIRVIGSHEWRQGAWWMSAGLGATLEPFLALSSVEGGATRSSAGLLLGPVLAAAGGYTLGPGTLQLLGTFTYLSHQDGVFELGGPGLSLAAGYRMRLTP